jgi:hypothetical protein
MDNSSSSDKRSIVSPSNLFENLLLQNSSEHVVDPHTGLQAQINTVLNIMHAYLAQSQRQNSVHAPEVQDAVAAFHTVQPLLLHLSTMLNLLVRAGAEINGNPFLDEGTTLHEIRQFLHQQEVMSLMPQVIYDLEADQAEIVEDLLDLDPECDPAKNTVSGGFFPASEIHKTGSFPLSELAGPCGQADGSQEWEWVRTNSGLTREKGKGRHISGYILDLGQPLLDVPSRLRPMLSEARQKGLSYLVFY